MKSPRRRLAINPIACAGHFRNLNLTESSPMQRGIDQISDDRARSIIAEGLACIALIASIGYIVLKVL